MLIKPSNIGFINLFLYKVLTIRDIAEGLKNENAALIGDCAEVLTKVAEENPKLVVPFSESLLPLLSSKTKRVRWEAMHAICIITPLIAERLLPCLPELASLIQNDSSTIVRDYAIEAVSNLAATSSDAAFECFPILKESLHVWNGKHRGRALKGMKNVTVMAPDLALEIRMIAEEYQHDNRGVVKKAAKALITAIDKAD